MWNEITVLFWSSGSTKFLLSSIKDVKEEEQTKKKTFCESTHWGKKASNSHTEKQKLLNRDQNHSKAHWETASGGGRDPAALRRRRLTHQPDSGRWAWTPSAPWAGRGSDCAGCWRCWTNLNTAATNSWDITTSRRRRAQRRAFPSHTLTSDVSFDSDYERYVSAALSQLKHFNTTFKWTSTHSLRSPGRCRCRRRGRARASAGVSWCWTWSSSSSPVLSAWAGPPSPSPWRCSARCSGKRRRFCCRWPEEARWETRRRPEDDSKTLR